MTDVDDETNSVIAPLQDQRKCTRNSLCKATGFQIYATPRSETRHVRDLSEDLEDTSNPKVSTKPSAPTDHNFYILKEQLQQAIQDKEMDELEELLEQYWLFGRTCPDVLKCAHAELQDLLKTTQKLTASTTQPPPNPTAQQPQYLHQPQTIGLKTPRMETPTWNPRDSYNYYSWLSSCSKSFDQSNCNSIARTQLMLQVMPLD